MASATLCRFEGLDMEALLPAFAAIGTARYGEILLGCLHEMFGTTEIFGYVKDLETGHAVPPVIVASSSRIGDPSRRSIHYCNGFYSFDPVCNAFLEMPAKEVRIIRSRLSVGPRDRNRAIFADQSGLDEKISIGFKGSQLVVVNLYRLTGEGTSDEDLERLARIAQPLLLGMAAQARNLPRSSPADATIPLIELERRLSSLRPDLTTREREVCARTVAGMTAEKIADELRIAPSSVITYRRRAYDRLGINSPYQLLGWFAGGSIGTMSTMRPNA